MGTIAPDGYLKCDGATYNIEDYPLLAKHFEDNFGTKNNFGGDGINTFAVPDLQGEFLRCTGTNPNSGEGSGSNVGVHQAGTQHTGVYVDNAGSIVWQVSSFSSSVDVSVPGKAQRWQGYSGQSTSQSAKTYTSRPTNTSVWYLIKY